MPNSQCYEAVLKVQRWQSPPLLSHRDAERLTRDMEFVERTLADISAELKRVKLQAAALRDQRLRIRGAGQGSLVNASVPISKKAQAIAEAAGDGPIDVYLYTIGTVRWFKKGTKYEGKAEYIGTYDAGCDWRVIVEDLQA